MNGVQTAEAWVTERRAEKLAPWILLLFAVVAIMALLWFFRPAPWHVELSVDGDIVIAESQRLGLSWDYHRATYRDGGWYWTKGTGQMVSVPNEVLATINSSEAEQLEH